MISNDIDVIEKLDERRDAPRANIAGRYTMQLDPCDGRDVVTCAVLDYSVTGARLQLPQDMALPMELQVVIGTLSQRHGDRYRLRRRALQPVMKAARAADGWLDGA